MIIGQAPGRKPGPVLGGRNGKRLAGLIGVPDLSGFELVNLLNEFPGKSGKGDRFPMREARQAALTMAPKLVGRKIVLLGQRVARAFGVSPEPALCWHDARIACFAVMPHPSGISRWWNDPRNVRRARRFLRTLR